MMSKVCPKPLNKDNNRITKGHVVRKSRSGHNYSKGFYAESPSKESRHPRIKADGHILYSRIPCKQGLSIRARKSKGYNRSGISAPMKPPCKSGGFEPPQKPSSGSSEPGDR